MKTISKMILQMVILVIMGFVGTGYADPITQVVDLPCCTGENCPTKFESPGEPGVKQTVSFKGVSIDINGQRESITIFAGDPGYRDWQRLLLKKPQEIRDRLRDAGRVDVQVSVQCSSYATSSVLEKGKSITCPVGDEIVVTQDNPKCDDPKTGLHSIIELTKIKEEKKNPLDDPMYLEKQKRITKLVDLMSEKPSDKLVEEMMSLMDSEDGLKLVDIKLDKLNDLRILTGKPADEGLIEKFMRSNINFDKFDKGLEQIRLENQIRDQKVREAEERIAKRNLLIAENNKKVEELDRKIMENDRKIAKHDLSIEKLEEKLFDDKFLSTLLSLGQFGGSSWL